MKKNSMKMMTLCLLFTLCLSGIFLFSTSVYAEDAKITIEDVKAVPGETIEIKVKIVEGKVGKYYKENCLLEQAFVKDDKLSVRRQCELLGINRSSLYYEPKEPDEAYLALQEELMKRISAPPINNRIAAAATTPIMPE